MSNPWENINVSIEQDTLRRALFARLEAARLSGEQLVVDYRNKLAENFLLAGITLIPSEHLQDHQMVVSRGIYDAAKRMCHPEQKEVP